MTISHRRRNLSSGRKLQLEQLEARRVFAGVDFDFALPIGNGTSAAAANAVAADVHGSTFVTGSFRGTVDFDPNNVHQDSADVLTALGTHSDIFIAKYSPSGVLEWARSMGSDNLGNIESERGMDLIVDSTGNAYITGDFYRQVTMGATNLTSNGGSDAFVAKVDASGEVLWASSWGTAGSDVGRYLAFAADGDLLVTSAAPNNATPLQKFDSSTGSNIWQINLPSSPLGNGAKIAVDHSGAIYVSNAFSGALDADPGAGTFQITTGVTTQGTYLLKLSDSAQFEWVRTFENQLSSPYGSSYPTDLAIDSAGNILLSGGYRQQVDFDPSSQGYYQLPIVSSGSYLAKFDSSGAWQWATNGTGPQLLIGEDDAIYTIGSSVQKRDASGAFLWQSDTVDQSSLNSSAAFSVNSAVITGDGKIKISGTFNGTLDFDAGIQNTTLNSSVSTGYLLSLKDGEGATPLKLELFSDDFDVSEWNGVWVEDSQNDWFRSAQRSTLGGYSAEVDGSANNATLTTVNVIDLTGLESAELTFDWLIESGFDSGEYLSLDISTDGGASWTQDVRRLNGNVSVENVWHSEVVDMTPYMTANTKIRFRSKVSASDEDANVDNVRITGIVAGPNSAPVADAGGGYVMNEGSSVVLSGLGSFDSDGTITGYAWDLDGDGQYDDGNGATAVFSTVASGSHTVGLQVTDNRGATATATAMVTVNNVAPTADAGDDQTLTLGNSASLSASGSVDPGLDIVSYLWDLDNDGVFDDRSGVLVNYTPAATGAYTIRVQVTDGDGATSIDQMQLVVTEVPAETTLFEDSFEVAEWNGLWVEDSQNDWFRSTQRASHGTRSAEVDGLANNATLTMASGVNLSGYASGTLTFDWLIESGFDAGEFLSLDISTNGGATWIQDVRRLNGDVSTEDVWHHESVDLSSYASSNLKIRFRSSVSSSTEDANVDNVKIVASTGGAGLLAAMSASSLDAYFADLAKKRKL